MSSNVYKILARQLLLEKMDAQERQAYLFLTSQDKSFSEIKKELEQIKAQVEKNKYSFATDFASNVAGNAAFDAFVYLLSKAFKKIV